MISLRSKTILSLIIMSLIGIAMTALLSRILIVQRFDDLAHDPVAEEFLVEAVAYYNHYGSWDAALEAERLFSFVNRMRASGELPQRVFYEESVQPYVFLREGAYALAVREARQLPPPGSPDQESVPPPPYIILDNESRVILSPISEDIGKAVPGIKLDYSIPVMNRGETIGYLYSDMRAALINQEAQYLEAINESWWMVLVLVASLSIPFGILLGRKLAGPIDSLDHAIRAMQPGSLEQEVPVKSKDELGQLTKSFNQMSKDLAYAYKELETSRRKMEEMSLQDPLTELPNRRSFDESAQVVLAQAYRHNRPCVLAMIDVDRFKQINDNYSHATGDLVLKLLGGLLRANLREVDILARYGGEEFLVLFPETDLKTAYHLMERLREFVAEHQWPDVDKNLQITVSAGLVEINIDDTSPNALDKAFNAADKMLYKAKDGGRNRTEC